MKTKTIKVAYSNRYTEKSCLTVPKLQVEGKWLSELGFSVGSTVMVEYGEGSVTIRLLTEKEQAERDRNAAHEELKRRRAEIRRLQRKLENEQEALPCVAESASRYGAR